MTDAAEAQHTASGLEEGLHAAERAAARVDSFVGRKRELATLGGALQDASAGSARLILISGEPGIGKTRLAEEFALNAQRGGARLLVGRCHQGEGAPPLWPWVQILRRALRGEAAPQLIADLGGGAAAIAQLVPELPQRGRAGDEPLSGLDPNQVRFHLFDAVVNFLQRRSARHLLVVVLDDLQWAQRPTLLLLQFLVTQIRDARLLVIGTYRDGDLGAGDPLTQALPDLMRELGCETVALSGLPRAQLAPLIAGSTGAEAPGALVDAVYGISEGNPFFTREVVRLLASEGSLQTAGGRGMPRISLPQSLREVVRRRLARLSADCNQLLEAGAVLGRDFALDHVGLVTALDRGRLLEVTEEALAARVIRAAPDRERVYSFAHAVIREGLYDDIPASRRAEIHGRIAVALEQGAGGEPGHAGDAVFLHEGEYWSIAWGGAVCRLRDGKGLRYLGQLLRHPGHEFHVRELLGLVADVADLPAVPRDGRELRVQALGDAGPVLDAKAKAAYKRKLDELREDLEDAERCNDPGRVSRARAEMEFLTNQLAAAVGLGGRDRHAVSDAERARLAVTKRIKAALKKICVASPCLGAHLTSTISTGYSCVYAPKTDIPPLWSF